jgi:hypothetical protein
LGGHRRRHPCADQAERKGASQDLHT